MSLGKTIVRLRMQKQWKQKDLAEKMGVHQRNLVRWEHDQVKPRAKVIEKLAEVLEVSTDELLSEAAFHHGILERDPEMVEILEQFCELETEQREALKLVLRDLVTLKRLETTLHRRR